MWENLGEMILLQFVGSASADAGSAPYHEAASAEADPTRMTTAINWRIGDIAIRDGTLLVDGEAIPITDILCVSERRTTHRTRGSDAAFVVMLAAVLTGAAVSSFVPGVGSILLGITAIAWFLAWKLRGKLWTISLHRSSPHQTTLKFHQ